MPKKILQDAGEQLMKLEASQRSFYTAIAAIATEVEAQQFLQDLCTPAELRAMMDRWGVVALLKAGKSYREIYKETKVSVTTIGRVARYLTLGSGGYDLIYQRLEKQRNEHKRKSPISHPKKRTIKS